MWFDSRHLFLAKRTLKQAINLVRDPPPRLQQLVLKEVAFRDGALRYVLKVRGRTLEHSFIFDQPTTALLRDADLGEMQGLLACLGLLMTPLYFRLGDFASVHCEIAGLDDASTGLFEDVIRNSLGEFRMRVGLDPLRPVKITSKSESPPEPAFRRNPSGKAILMNGGGKDTAVSAELAKALQIPFVWCTYDKNIARTNVALASGVEDEISFTMRRDPSLKEASRYPPSSGHFPVIQILSGVGALLAYLYGFRYVIFGNEYSADFGNLTHRGMEINHQYGKSTAFATAFNDIMKRCALRDADCFSILRPFYDIAVGRLLARFPAYHDKFISCNRDGHNNQWCKRCSKCAWTFLVLYPFLAEDQVIGIFGENLFYREIIRREIWNLAVGSIKPWDCVGTQEEVRLALALALERMPEDLSSWPRRADFSKLLEGLDPPLVQLLQPRSDGHCLPPTIAAAMPAALDRMLENGR
jgi:UDP-N-acetyl-alpha-D-muramoyl-L-alanyl-L-glutamate epimerase